MRLRHLTDGRLINPEHVESIERIESASMGGRVEIRMHSGHIWHVGDVNLQDIASLLSDGYVRDVSL